MKELQLLYAVYLYQNLFHIHIHVILSWSVIGLIIVGLLLEILYLIASRYRFAEYDNYIFPLTTHLFDGSTHVLFIRNHFIIFGGLFLTTALSFAAIYNLLPEDLGLFYSNFLNPVNKQITDFFNYIYFSITTLCTVGYGDIYAGHVVSRVFSSIEMALGFIIFILLLSSITTVKNFPRIE